MINERYFTKKVLTSPKLLWLLNCAWLRGLLESCGAERIMFLFRQVAPTTGPTFPEKPPMRPFCSVPIRLS
ncbi:MAG TPA: hypothetical protein DEG69_19565 [Flavobacteriaceae bacterium]|nr:hypothetical protein [Flavobacteriaceae bacterium]